MIHRITIENFLSIADKQELVLRIPENAPDLDCFRGSRSNSDIRLPTVVGLFGPNASGKSTVLRAIVSAAIFACSSFEKAEIINVLFQAYRQKNWWGKPTKITLDFDGQLNEKMPSALFRYELHIHHQDKYFGNKFVAYEALSYAPNGRFRRLFERDKQSFYFGEELGISDQNDPRKEITRPNASVISTLTQFNHPLFTHLHKLMKTLTNNMIIKQDSLDTNSQVLSFYKNDPAILEQLNQEIKRLDIGPESISIEQGPNGLFAKCTHTGLDEIILLAEESAGAQRFINIFPLFYYALKTGSVAVIDEIDTDLHPLLLPELFRWFNDPEHNPYAAQLFFTAHNPGLLDELEKEQIFFTEKLYGKPTHIYGARDIKGLRREPSLMKKYLSGELGAIPHTG